MIKILKLFLSVTLILCGINFSHADNDVNPPYNFSPSAFVAYDSFTSPQKIDIFVNKVAAHNRLAPETWGHLTLQCLSNSSSQYGKCSTVAVPKLYSVLNIPLEFTDSVTGNTVIINISLSKNASTGSTVDITSPLNPEWRNSYGVRFSEYILATEFKKFKIPGDYTAQLKMGLYNSSDNQGSGNHKINDWITSFEIKITDLHNQKIFFPQFPVSEPLVNLNLNNRPGTGKNIKASGSASLDMCLYDGGISANNITMIFQDEQKPAPERESGLFSVYRNGGDMTSSADRLDYELKVRNPVTGSIDSILNGNQITWASYKARKMQRPIVLPGVTGVSLCVPAPLFLITPSFMINSKTAGQYTGKITVTYMPVTTIIK